MAERPAATRDDAIALLSKLRDFAQTLTEGERAILTGALAVAAATGGDVQGYAFNTFGDQAGPNLAAGRPSGGDFGPLGGSVKTGTSFFEAADEALGPVDEAVGDAVGDALSDLGNTLWSVYSMGG